MAIITKQEYDKIQKKANVFLTWAIVSIVITVLLAPPGAYLSEGNIAMTILFATLMIGAFLSFAILLFKSMFNSSVICSRCGEYTKGEHSESECLGALKVKLATIK